MKIKKSLSILKSGKNCYVKTLNAGALSWYSAVEKIEEQGSGWRLPTIDELEEIYEQLHITGVMALPEAIYWSSSEFSDDAVWYFDFKNGMDGTAIKKLAAYVIVIREVT